LYRPHSSLLKPSPLYLGIIFLFVFILSGCTSSPASQAPTPPPTQVSPTPTASPVPTVQLPVPTVQLMETSVPQPIEKALDEKRYCVPIGEPESLPEASFDELPEAVLEFMNTGGSPEQLADALYLAGFANLPEPTAAGDLTGDGVDEVVVSIFEPDSLNLPPAGLLLIFTCDENAYRLAYQEDSRPSQGAPGIRFLRDLNADGRAELVVSSASCGAHTCFEQVQVIQWDGTQFKNHLEGETSDLPYPSIYLSPTGEDELYDLQVTGSGFGSVGAGPQRNVTRTWSFNEDTQLWQISEFRQEPSDYRIHVLHDARAASEMGDYQSALMLYNRVISDTTLEDWDDPQLEQAVIIAYARYQMSVIYTLQDRDSFAGTIIREMEVAYPPDSLQRGYFEMAAAYIDAYQAGGAQAGCQAVQDFASGSPGLLDPLGPQTFGYGNPVFTLEDLCP
jgi:hypothetical protein